MNSIVWMLVGATVATLVTLVLTRRRPIARRSGGDLSPAELTDLAEMRRDRRRSSEIIERMAEGVLVLNEALTPNLANTSARSLLGLPQQNLPMEVPSQEVLAVARRALDE